MERCWVCMPVAVQAHSSAKAGGRPDLSPQKNVQLELLLLTKIGDGEWCSCWKDRDWKPQWVWWCWGQQAAEVKCWPPLAEQSCLFGTAPGAPCWCSQVAVLVDQACWLICCVFPGAATLQDPPACGAVALIGLESGLHWGADIKHPQHNFPPARYMHICMHSLWKCLYTRKKMYKA